MIKYRNQILKCSSVAVCGRIFQFPPLVVLWIGHGLISRSLGPYSLNLWNHNLCDGRSYRLFWPYRKGFFHTQVHSNLKKSRYFIAHARQHPKALKLIGSNHTLVTHKAYFCHLLNIVNYVSYSICYAYSPAI